MGLVANAPNLAANTTQTADVDQGPDPEAVPQAGLDTFGADVRAAHRTFA